MADHAAPATESTKRTPFFDRHVAAGAKMTPFGGWDMPLHYGSQVTEHHAVRQKVGVFDVSHMGQVQVRGRRALEFVQRLVMNDPTKLETHQAQYSPICNHEGGILDDLIVSRLGDDHYFIVVNASTQDSDFAHMRAVAKEFDMVRDISLMNESNEWTMLAVQGPEAERVVSELLPGPDWAALKYFHVRPTLYDGVEGLVSRTGYTGEDGFELIFPEAVGFALWDALMAAGVQPCGLGARDTLRIEAGYLLYGQDMDTKTNPIEVSLGWACKEARDVAPVGAAAVAKARAIKENRRLMGIELVDRGIPRHETWVMPDDESVTIGYVTSGTFSPTLQKGIAMAVVSHNWRKPGTPVKLKVRGKGLAGRITKMPFVQDTSIRKN